NSRAQMWISVSVNLFNIAASLVMVYGLEAGILGVAAGTLSAQWVGLAVGVSICRRRYQLVRVSLGEVIEWSGLKRFFSINLDIFLRTVCLVAVTMWFTRAGAMQSTVMLDVNVLMMQLFMLFSYFMDGFAYAGEALCGRMSGAGDRIGLVRSVRALIRYGVLLAVVFAMLYACAGKWIIGLMCGEADVIDAASGYLVWAAVIPLAGFLAFIWDGVFIGTTLTRLMLLSMVSATVVFFVMYLICFPVSGNHGLWFAFVSYLLVRGALQSALGRRMLCYRQ
ncbi:MAG: MATE family efflux transporter, partial [Muribaculaceae bacterium]|nr:MATE family efflux transporter [Muribaculaceae bacterium]